MYPSYIMEKVRQRLGLESYDTSRDDEINNMSRNAVLDACLEWEGIFAGGYGKAKEFSVMHNIRADYVINEGEIPWWELPQGEGRRRTHRTQYFRVWRKGRRDLTHVQTSKTPEGFEVLYAPYKREPANTCELCGARTKPQALGWHHWVYENPSIGLWTCPWCNQFAEAIDVGGVELAEKYILYKELLDRQYADGEIVRLAKLAKQNHRICVMVNGLAVNYRAFGKRDVPKDRLCELCGYRKCSSYHHWDDAILGKGIWVCMYDHALAERIDTYGMPFVDKYMALKARDEHRVSEILLQQVAISL